MDWTLHEATPGLIQSAQPGLAPNRPEKIVAVKDVWPVPNGTGHNHQFKRTGNLTVR